jgi:hypothetical protein
MQERKIDLEMHGFRDLFFSKGWRVSFSDYDPFSNDASSIHKMEKHLETEEVFSLVRGTVYLVTGGKGACIGSLEAKKLKKETLYVVEKDEWHVAVFQQKSAVLIVENEAESLSKSTEINGIALLELLEEPF